MSQNVTIKLNIQPWTNVWSSLKKIKHTAFSDHFNKNRPTIYLTKLKNFLRFRNSSQEKLEALSLILHFYPHFFSKIYCGNNISSMLLIRPYGTTFF